MKTDVSVKLVQLHKLQPLQRQVFEVLDVSENTRKGIKKHPVVVRKHHKLHGLTQNLDIENQ